MAENANITGEESPRQVEQDPTGWAKRWTVEFEAARKFMKPWREQDAKDSLAAYEDERTDHENEQRVNLFWANVTTQLSLMYGRVPQVVVDREHQDPSDDAARVAGPIILQRLINGDIRRPNDNYCRVLKNVLKDSRVVGYGFARVRYEATFEDKPDPKTGKLKKTKTYEEAATDYIYWDDQLFSPCRVFDQMRWWASRTPMGPEEIDARFKTNKAGRKFSEVIPYDATALDTKADEDPGSANPWRRAWVWEVWDKTDKVVYWLVEGHPEVLDRQPDPYGLDGFFPFPEPMMSNLSTSKFLPKPDYIMSQDLYREVNQLQTRIRLLEKALRVAGIYDQDAGQLEVLVTSTDIENKLIPVTGWGRLMEKGGLEGVIQLLPMKEIAATLIQLRVQQRDSQQLLYEVTGQSDLQRGQVAKGGATATESAAKVRYGSVRVQDLADEFARFATGLQQLRAEIITKLFDNKTILRRANVQHLTEKPEVIMEALDLLRKEFPQYRVIIRSETMAAQDFAALKQDRVELLQAASGVMAASAPLVQAAGPLAALVGLNLLKWTIAGMRGTAEIEGIFDKMIEQATQILEQQKANPQAQPPDPKVMAAQAKQQSDQMKGQMDLQKLQLQHTQKMTEMDGEALLTERQQVVQREQNVQEAREVAQVKGGAQQQKQALRGAK